MITEDFVSFEIAKLLKEKGFQQLQDNCGYFTTEMIYSINVDDNGEHHFAHQYPAGIYNKDKYIAAPTIQMAMKWLREEKHYYIQVMLDSWACGGHMGYYVVIQKTNSNFEMMLQDALDEVFYKTPEEACEEAIKYCLENLI